jgi:hypothetical protein
VTRAPFFFVTVWKITLLRESGLLEEHFGFRAVLFRRGFHFCGDGFLFACFRAVLALFESRSISGQLSLAGA